MVNTQPIKRALISVSDKYYLAEFAKALTQFNIDILSTEGTARLLRKSSIPVLDVSSYTGFPEIMGGRVKTLHPKIHGALLYRPKQDDQALTQHGIDPIDLLVVNLYPFTQTVAQPHCSLEDAVESIDIGGPTMIRAAAKNFQCVTVVVDPSDYQKILKEIDEQGGIKYETRFSLAKKAFAHTATYDAAISNYLNKISTDESRVQFPDTVSWQMKKKDDLRYGENPHQQAAFYVEDTVHQHACIATAKQVQGKPLSFNNIADADAALECAKQFNEQPACVIMKHANPCGVALADHQVDAYQRAFATDSISAFGGIIAFNRPLTSDAAKTILKNQFVEVVIAPEITKEALTILHQKPNIRALETGNFDKKSSGLDIKSVNGGWLVQTRDHVTIRQNELQCVTKRKPAEEELLDLLFAWRVVAFTKSNAIVYAKNLATIGIGAGQMSRIDSVKIALMKAEAVKLATKGAVMASDAFFPFRDGIDSAARAGITAIVQPGGSLRDNEAIQAANEANIAMLFTGRRHFRH